LSDKKRLILSAAQRVFARKGYRSASIQEIAGEAGVAKGSIYLHFRSKDELALAAVADVYDRVRRRLAELEADEGLTPRERFVRQLEEQLAVGEDNAEWIRRLWLEQADGIHEAMPGFVLRIRAETTEWLLRSIRNMYGEACAPYACDIALMMQGALGEVIGFHLLGGKPIEPQRLARYLASRMDDIAAGLARSGERPLVEGRELDALMRRLAGGRGPASWQAAIRKLRERLDAVRADGAVRGELEEALGLLAAEASKMLPSRVFLRAMLGHVRALAPEPLRSDVERLAREMLDA
jgi:AcrR family transcriptional regulator